MGGCDGKSGKLVLIYNCFRGRLWYRPSDLCIRLQVVDTDSCIPLTHSCLV